MHLNDLTFPVLCFSQNLVRVSQTVDALTTCSRPALRKGGYYSNLFLVDSAGTGLRVTGAEKLHGVGPFWGYNIFLNRRIRVRLNIDNVSIMVRLAEVKQRVLNSFEQWHGWSSRGDFDNLKASIEKATSIPEIITRLSA